MVLRTAEVQPVSEEQSLPEYDLKMLVPGLMTDVSSNRERVALEERKLGGPGGNRWSRNQTDWYGELMG